MRTVWSITKVLLVYLAMQIFAGVLIGIFVVIKNISELDNFEALLEDIMAAIPQTLILAGLLTILIYYAIYRGKNKNLFVRTRFTKISKQWVGMSILAGFSLLFLSSLIVQGMSTIFPDALNSHNENMAGLESAGFIPLFIAVALMAPFLEELIFRGMLFERLERKVKPLTMVLITSLIFGVIHFNIVQSTYATIIGIFLGYSLLFTNSLWVPILIHFGNNAFSVILGTVFASFFDANPVVEMVLSIVMVVTVLPYCIYYFIKNRVPYVLLEEPEALPYTIFPEESQPEENNLDEKI